MNPTTAVAQHLNIAAEAIIKIEEWATVLWVKFQGGCRFVSKKIMNTLSKIENEMVESIGEIIADHNQEVNKYAEALKYSESYIDQLIEKYGWDWYKTLTIKDNGNGVFILRHEKTNWDVATLHSAFATPDEMIAKGFAPWSINSVRGDGYWIRK